MQLRSFTNLQPPSPTAVHSRPRGGVAQRYGGQSHVAWRNLVASAGRAVAEPNDRLSLAGPARYLRRARHRASMTAAHIMTVPPATPAARLAEVRTRVATAAREAGRDPAAVALIAVSKTFEPDEILPVIAAGQRSFGENRVQEAQRKWPALRAAYPDLRLHLIGPLQSNKAADAVALFDCIHTVDRPKLAAALAQEIRRQGRTPKLFVQVNTGEEAQKAGIGPHEAAPFVRHCRDDLGLLIDGLMCIPPVDDMAAVHFAFLAQLAADCGLTDLSMGMSADYETAVNLGATHVRVGSAIFGTR